MVLFDKRTLLMLMKSYQSYLSFVISEFSLLFKNFFLNSNLWKYALIFSFRNFVILIFARGYLFHLRIIFVSGLNLRSGSTLLVWTSLCCCSICWKDYPCPIFVTWQLDTSSQALEVIWPVSHVFSEARGWRHAYFRYVGPCKHALARAVSCATHHFFSL